jgi:hypothetical protein
LTVEIPPVVRTGVDSYVRAWNVADAERVASSAERLVPAVRAIKQVAKSAPLVIVSRWTLPDNMLAAHLPLGVVLGLSSRSLEDFCLAHELSHWFGDETWQRLPYALEEGLAEQVATLVVPPRSSKHLYSLSFVVPEEEGIEGFRAACAAISEDRTNREHIEELRVRAFGFAAASAIGVEGLRALCERAEREGFDKVPTDWIVEALPFPTDRPDAFKAAIRRRVIALDAQEEEERQRAATVAAPGDALPSE